ncbi:MAG: hypothetical protein IT361_18645 [Gemmatimonadaceae bacterium]|nr:hypothetical protein [Gemmatimonadaceae bacterium]
MRLPSLLAMSLVVTSYGNSDASVSVARTSPVELGAAIPVDDCAACYNGINVTFAYSFHAHYECPEQPAGQIIICLYDGYRFQPWGGHQYGTGNCSQHTACYLVRGAEHRGREVLAMLSRGEGTVDDLRGAFRIVDVLAPKRPRTRLSWQRARGHHPDRPGGWDQPVGRGRGQPASPDLCVC